MDRFKGLTIVVYILAGLLVFKLGMLVVMLRPNSAQLWLSLAVLAIICLYLISLSLGLIKELKNKQKQ